MGKPGIAPTRAATAPKTTRRLGWSAVAAAIAAATILVPPLVTPKTRPQAGTATPPALTPSPSRTPPASPPAASAGTRSSPPATAFSTIKVHAANPGNLRAGARIIPCRSCNGGSRVGYIGGPNTLTMLVRGVAEPGRRTLVITYETDGPRTLKIQVNNDPVRTRVLAGAHDFLIPAQTTLSVFIPAGTSTIKFFNDTGSAPDINRIVVS